MSDQPDNREERTRYAEIHERFARSMNWALVSRGIVKTTWDQFLDAQEGRWPFGYIGIPRRT